MLLLTRFLDEEQISGSNHRCRLRRSRRRGHMLEFVSDFSEIRRALAAAAPKAHAQGTADNPAAIVA